MIFQISCHKFLFDKIDEVIMFLIEEEVLLISRDQKSLIIKRSKCFDEYWSQRHMIIKG